MKETDGEIVGVNWSPPFEGPLSLEPDQVRPYYRAYAAFEYMLDKSLPVPDVDGEHLLSRDEILEFANYARKNTWECRLKPGEMLVFSNRRMVHGRKGFYSKVSLGMRNTDANDHDDPHPSLGLVVTQILMTPFAAIEISFNSIADTRLPSLMLAMGQVSFKK